MPTLYEISHELDALIALCEHETTTDADRERLIDEWFNQNETVLFEKVDAYAAVIRQLEGEEQMLKAETDRLAKRRKSRQELATTLRGRLASVLSRIAPQGLKTPRNTVSVQYTGSRLMLIGKPADLPPEFQKVESTTVPDWDAIKAALAAGEVLDFVVEAGNVPFVKFK